MRKFVIGDIHSSYKALLQVFEKSNFDFNNDKVIFLGDINDSWSEAKECMDFIMSIPNKVVIMGNHDEWALYYYTGTKHYLNVDDTNFNIWKAHGGAQTIKSLGDINEINRDYIEFMKTFKYFHEEDGKLFVHAGYSLLTDDNDDLFHPSKNHPFNLAWDRELINTVYLNRDKTINPTKTLWSEVFVGHTTTTCFDESLDLPQKWHHVWNMDTASAFDGKLSMMNIDTKEIFQSDKVMKLYPNERGRNKLSWNELNS